MANASVKITIKPFTDPAPTPSPPSGSGSSFQYGSYGPIKSLQTILLTDTTSGSKRLKLTQPKNPLSVDYVVGLISVGGRGNLKLNIAVVDDASPPTVYAISGLLFTPRDASTVSVFPDFSCNGNGSLDLDDVFKTAGPFSFLLVVQNASGGVAVIDPQISNVP